MPARRLRLDPQAPNRWACRSDARAAGRSRQERCGRRNDGGGGLRDLDGGGLPGAGDGLRDLDVGGFGLPGLSLAIAACCDVIDLFVRALFEGQKTPDEEAAEGLILFALVDPHDPLACQHHHHFGVHARVYVSVLARLARFARVHGLLHLGSNVGLRGARRASSA